MKNDDEQQALAAAMQALLLPLARLLVARGVPFAVAEEGLKTAMVQAAREAHAGGLQHRLVSRISTATGINRREVTRLTREHGAAEAPPRSLASAIFTRWRTAPEYRDSRGHPRPLARHGDRRSFEALARSITQDVHPRTLLDELLRLGLATHDVERDVVSLALDTFVPAGDRARMLDFLAQNVGDHLSAAVANVLGRTPPYPEQAVFVDELSKESAEAAQAWLAQHWQQLLAAIVPFLERLGEEDEERPADERRHRLRAGLYGYAEAVQPAGAIEATGAAEDESLAVGEPSEAGSPPAAPAAPRRRKSATRNR